MAQTLADAAAGMGRGLFLQQQTAAQDLFPDTAQGEILMGKHLGHLPSKPRAAHPPPKPWVKRFLRAQQGCLFPKI